MRQSCGCEAMVSAICMLSAHSRNLSLPSVSLSEIELSRHAPFSAGIAFDCKQAGTGDISNVSKRKLALIFCTKSETLSPHLGWWLHFIKFLGTPSSLPLTQIAVFFLDVWVHFFCLFVSKIKGPWLCNLQRKEDCIAHHSGC